MRYGTSRIGRGCPSGCHGINDASHVVASWDDGHVDVLSGLRVGLSDSAGSVLEPMLPFHQTYFVPTVFIVGSSIMVVNTIIRSFFMDPLQQAHFSHRSRQIGKQLREARMARDTAMADKMQKIQLEMMPEQMKMQSA